MLFGASTFVWTSPFSTETFDIAHTIKKMGYDIIEVAVEDADAIDWVKLKEIVKEIDLKVTISGAFGAERDISSIEQAFREQGKKYIIDCIKIAHFMESPIFGGPVYSAVGKTRLVADEQKKQERAWCVATLQEVGKVAQDYGIVVGVEPLNRFETDMINTVDQVISLVKEVSNPAIQIVMDTFHANIEEKNIPNAIRKIGKELLCHVQGNESDRGTPGTGHIDWLGIKEALVEIDYQGGIVLETFGAPSKELARAASIWRPLANSADELAQEGLNFYQSVFR